MADRVTEILTVNVEIVRANTKPNDYLIHNRVSRSFYI